MNTKSGRWFMAAGISTIVGWTIFTVQEPTYYDAARPSDYVAVIGLSLSLVLTGVALVLLWRSPPVRRGSAFILLAGVGAVGEGAGNVLEDVFNVEQGVWLFFGGGLLMMICLIVAGVSALTVDSLRRWSGLFLLFAFPGGMLGFGLVMMSISWILFGLWLSVERQAYVVALALSSIPAIAIAIGLYLPDVIG